MTEVCQQSPTAPTIKIHFRNTDNRPEQYEHLNIITWSNQLLIEYILDKLSLTDFSTHSTYQSHQHETQRDQSTAISTKLLQQEEETQSSNKMLELSSALTGQSRVIVSGETDHKKYTEPSSLDTEHTTCPHVMLTKDMQAASKRILTSRSSNCSTTSSQRDLPVKQQQISNKAVFSAHAGTESTNPRGGRLTLLSRQLCGSSRSHGGQRDRPLVSLRVSISTLMSHIDTQLVTLRIQLF